MFCFVRHEWWGPVLSLVKGVGSSGEEGYGGDERVLRDVRSLRFQLSPSSTQVNENSYLTI